MATSELPDIAQVLAPLLERVSLEQRPLLIAIAERMAAVRYRRWARAEEDATRSAELRDCADREEEIAARVEALFPDASTIQAGIRAGNPGLERLDHDLFADRPVQEQYTMQARGERVGASTWRSFAKHAEPAARQTYLDCAALEEASAAVLDAILADSR